MYWVNFTYFPRQVVLLSCNLESFSKIKSYPFHKPKHLIAMQYYTLSQHTCFVIVIYYAKSSHWIYNLHHTWCVICSLENKSKCFTFLINEVIRYVYRNFCTSVSNTKCNIDGTRIIIIISYTVISLVNKASFVLLQCSNARAQLKNSLFG